MIKYKIAQVVNLLVSCHTLATLARWKQGGKEHV